MEGIVSARGRTQVLKHAKSMCSLHRTTDSVPSFNPFLFSPPYTKCPIRLNNSAFFFNRWAGGGAGKLEN